MGEEIGTWQTVRNGSTTLAVCDFGGRDAPVLVLHGLAGHAGEWESVARHLSGWNRVLALDLRGHGRSERHPTDVSPESFCSDVVAVVAALGLGSVHLVGQSFGGHIGFLVAAMGFPVASLTVIEAVPEPLTPAEVDRVGRWLASWPASFASQEAASTFFSGMSSPATWVAGLEARNGAYWPRFDTAVLAAALNGLLARSWWDDWRSITAPTLVVRGDRGDVPAELAQRMADSIDQASVLNVRDAGHDVHLDQPAALAQAIATFVASPKRR